MRTYPHCDARVLHKKGECQVCDEHAADLQEIRLVWGINFTNHHDLADKNGVTMLPCPAEVARPLVTINRWGGNTAKTQADWDALTKQMEEIAAQFQQGQEIPDDSK